MLNHLLDPKLQPLFLTGAETKPNLHLSGRPTVNHTGQATGGGEVKHRRRKKPRAPHTGGLHRPVYQISRIGPFEPFGHTQFRRYTIAAIFSFSAFFVQMLVRGWLVNELTGSPFLVSLVPVLYIAPMLVFTLIGGELADRFRRTRVVAIGETVVFGTYAALAALTLADVAQAWHVLVLTGVHGITSALYAPARQTMIGDLVRPRLQRAALGLSPATFNLAQISGPLVGGVVLATAGAGAASLLGALLILPAIPLYAKLRPVMKSPSTLRGNFMQNLREGASYILGHTTLRWYLVAGFALIITVNTWGALFPPLAKEVLGQGAGGLAALQVAVGVGALLGAVTAVSLASTLGEKKLTIIAGFLFAGLVLALAISEVFLLSVAIAGMAAAVATHYFVTNMITMQLTAAPEFRSRVISVRFIMFGFGPAGMIIVGALAEFMGTQWALGISAVSGAALLLLISMFLRTETSPGPVTGGKVSSPQSTTTASAIGAESGVNGRQAGAVRSESDAAPQAAAHGPADPADDWRGNAA